MTKKCLCTISSKNPNQLLINTIQNVQLFYHEFDIVVVDSDSTDFTYYEQVPNGVKVEYCKNKNWELGAFYYSYNKYPDYDIYMFIQDSLLPLQRIPGFDTENYDKETVYLFHYEAMLWQGGYYEELGNVYRDSIYHFIAELSPHHTFNGGAHSSFMASNDATRKILQLEIPYIVKQIIKTKMDSLLSERTVGLVIDYNGFKKIDINPYFRKHSLKRDYL